MIIYPEGKNVLSGCFNVPLSFGFVPRVFNLIMYSLFDMDTIKKRRKNQYNNSKLILFSL